VRRIDAALALREDPGPQTAEAIAARRAKGEEEPPITDEERRHQELLAALRAK
jgi:hypothetical protein